MKKKNYKIKKIPIIKNSKGNLFKLVSKNHNFYNEFGEIYLSEVIRGKFKGWKYHEYRNQIITVVSGKVRFFFKKKLRTSLTLLI